MNEKHTLDAPDGSDLTGIEQIADHSELSSLYPHPHAEWEGKPILSQTEREQQRDRTQDALMLSLRRWFLVIGLLTPVPIILLVLIIVTGASIVTKETAMPTFMASLVALGLWFYLSSMIMRLIYGIFYNHTLIATPFLMIHLLFVTMCAQILYIVSRPLQSGSMVGNALIVSIGAVLASICLAAILVPLWSSVRLTGRMKFYLVFTIGLLLAGATAAVTFLS